ncbi:MAG: ATP phosphoribosyltransferase regulatory subunit [Patescibacteria group bacterium]
MPRLKKIQAVNEDIRVVNNASPVDLIPGDIFSSNLVLSKIHRVAQNFGYLRVETSPVEVMEFLESRHQLSDIKPDRYIHIDATSKKYGLRSHNFLSVLRAYSTGRVFEREKVTKWYYVEPAFNLDKNIVSHLYEFGIAHFGEPTSMSDAHLISMLKTLLEEFGINDVVFEINSKGCDTCLAYYQEVLSDFLQQNKYNFCANCQKTFGREAVGCPHGEASGLWQVFNCAGEQCQSILDNAPQIIDHLDTPCNHHFTGLLETLDELEIPYQLNPKLFGSHWLSHTIFRVKVQSAGSDIPRETNLGIGGRHNCFVSRITGQGIPTLAFSVPLSVLGNLVSGYGAAPKPERIADVFLINLSELAAKKSLHLFLDLWKNHISCAEQFGENGIKNQFKMAEKKGCPIALIVGQKEALEDNVILRDVRSGIQEVFSYDRIVEEVRKRLQE